MIELQAIDSYQKGQLQAAQRLEEALLENRRLYESQLVMASPSHVIVYRSPSFHKGRNI